MVLNFCRELFAKYSAVRHFRFLLEGQKFRLITDHRPLLLAMKRTMPPWSARQQQYLSFLAEFTSDLRHASGQTNVVADGLSRLPPMSATAVIKEAVIAAPFWSELHASKMSNEPVQPALSDNADPPGRRRRRAVLRLRRLSGRTRRLPRHQVYASLTLPVHRSLTSSWYPAARRRFHRVLPPASTGGVQECRHLRPARDPSSGVKSYCFAHN
jgi:hypothetical protein